MTRDHAYHGAEIALDRGDDWRDWAACRGEDPELWFPYDTDAGDSAKQICKRCSVREQCLEYALARRIDDGIWGGLTKRQRKRLRRRRAS